MAPSDRTILIGGSLLLALASGLTFVLAPRPEDQSPTPTSYSNNPGGARAAYLLLGEMGYQVERWERPPTELPEDPAGTLLILTEPFRISEGELAALREFVESGGRVIATGSLGTVLDPEWELYLDTFELDEWESYKAVYPSPVTRGVPKITLGSGASWDGDDPPSLIIYGYDEVPVVLATTMGSGRIVWCADATMLTNAGIKAEGNLQFLLNMLGPPGETQVLWDEYYHGHRISLNSYLAGTPIPWGFIQAGLLVVMILLAWARRSGPVYPPPEDSRLAPQEFTEMVGGLYERAGASSAAVTIVYHRFRSLLARQLGLPAAMKAEEIVKRLGDRLGDIGEIGTTLQDCETALKGVKRLEEHRALQLVQELHEYSGRLGLIPLTSQERSS